MSSPITTRRRAVLLAPAAILGVGLLGTGAWFALRPEPAIAIGGPFALQDGRGRTVTDRDFRGKVMLVYFGYTHCPDACPTALSDMANAVDMLPPAKRQDVAIVFITIDPARDTPAVVQDYVSAFQAPITALSGSADAIAAAARAYRVYYQKHEKADGGYDMDHSSIVYVMDQKGRFVANFTHASGPDKIVDKLRTLV